MMRRRIPILVVLALTLGAVGSTTQGDSPVTNREEVERRVAEGLERLAGPQPDTGSPNWQPIAENVGLFLTRDDAGLLRGRLYVKRGDFWHPVAVDGPQEIGPRVLPAR
jgi:hypothetical protein